ncbi:uncharacterized protein LOC131304658 [Rhododendron vialii]|uniref:uncharacterized protein LOC131304658 n=1 Tax=Rhododendron vialii TaxID=182163 RepID=UPI00265FE61B|nr:uncharacterized protein LOC131304658 [Rhododendron vialii]
MRRFIPAWFKKFPDWLEYSITKDATFCLYCYLFKPDIGDQAGGESFVGNGFSNWKKKRRLRTHVGGHNSAHTQAWRKCEDLLNQKQHIETIVLKQSEQARIDYRTQLNASIDCARFLLNQGLAFCGHDESEFSRNQDVKAIVLANAPQNNKLTSPEIQKDIVCVVAREAVNVIVRDVGDALFAILVDEARDNSIKEQMALAIRYVDKKGHVIERFLGVEHVPNTSAMSLKKAVGNLFCRLGLSIGRLRGQGYDGASNMQGEINGLKALILKENSSAHYVHCFAHQLQLALVAVAKKDDRIGYLFQLVSKVGTVVGASCKRRDILRENEVERVLKALNLGEIESGRGLNQETSLKRPGDTRRSSHYSSLVRLMGMFASVIGVLEIVEEDGTYLEQRLEATSLLESMQSFEFILYLHLMRTILEITNDLSQALQRKDQDIVNAMALLQLLKGRLQTMRESGWITLLNVTSSFCEKHEIVVPNMDDLFVPRGGKRRKAHKVTNLHHFRFEIFNSVIDLQAIELDARFLESTTELLLCVACLNPSNLFSSFEKEKLIHMAELYPQDFSSMDLMILDDQLDNYIDDMRTTIEFSSLHGISDLAQKMAEIGRHRAYPLVYLLLVLALTLPIVTATVERAFSAMNYVKNQWRNRMGDEWTSGVFVMPPEVFIPGYATAKESLPAYLLPVDATTTITLQSIMVNCFFSSLTI